MVITVVGIYVLEKNDNYIVIQLGRINSYLY